MASALSGWCQLWEWLETNRARLSTFTYRALVGVFAVAFLAGGCAAKKLPAYPTHPVSASRYTQVKDGLAVAIHPLVNPQESKTYFDTDLLSRGILAVFVRAENHSAPSTFLVLKDRFVLRMGEREEHRVPGREPAESDVRDDTAQGGDSSWVYGAMLAGPYGGFVVLAALAAVPVFIVAEKFHIHEERIKHKLLIEELQTKTISPGEETHGFVYFPLPPGQPHAGPWVLHLEVQDLRSQEVKPFDFVLDGQ